MSYKLDKALAGRVLAVVDKGLSCGLGEPEPGKMCVEAAVCFAMGLPHSDQPTCVGSAVRAFKIALNDKAWSSSEARAKGMRRVAIAQLGSDGIDQVAFAQAMAKEVIRVFVPIALRAAGKLCEKFKETLEAAAVLCEGTPTEASAREALKTANAAANAANAAANAAAYASNAAAAADAAAAAADAAAYASNAAADAAEAYAAAELAAYAADAFRDTVLSQAAEMAVSVLKQLKSPGCSYLYLTE